MDVIRHILHPYLDYYGRVGINVLLQPYERISTPLKKQVLDQIQLGLATADVRVGLKKNDGLTGYERHEHILNFMDKTVRKNIFIAQHNQAYRATVLSKLTYLSDPLMPDYSSCSQEFVARMTTLCFDMIVEINTKYPYLYPLTLPNATWSPVDAGNHIITDNEVYLAEQRKLEYEKYKAKCAQIQAKRELDAVKRQAAMANRMPAIEKGKAALFNRVLKDEPAPNNSIQLSPNPPNYWLRSQKARV